MKKEKIHIQITKLDRKGFRIDGIQGTIHIENFKKIFFDIFRPGIRQSGDLNLRIYGISSKAVVIPEFINKFYSHDFDNRRIIDIDFLVSGGVTSVMTIETTPSCRFVVV